MKKIDFHAHVKPMGSDAAAVDPKQLLSLYRDLNVEKGVILPLLSVKSPPGFRTSKAAREAAQQFPNRFFWFTTLDLTKPDVNGLSYYDFLEKEKELGAKGVGEITSKVYFDNRQVEELFSCCEALELPVLFHLSPDLSERYSYGVADDLGLPRLEKMLTRHPKLRYVGHAKPFWCEISQVDEAGRNKTQKEKVTEGRLPYLMRKFENLYCDLSAGSGSGAMMRDPDYAARFMEEFQDRLLYGCDICSGDEAHPKKFASFFDEMRSNGAISETVWRKIGRENAEKLLQLEQKNCGGTI